MIINLGSISAAAALASLWRDKPRLGLAQKEVLVGLASRPRSAMKYEIRPPIIFWAAFALLYFPSFFPRFWKSCSMRSFQFPFRGQSVRMLAAALLTTS